MQNKKTFWWCPDYVTSEDKCKSFSLADCQMIFFLLNKFVFTFMGHSHPVQGNLFTREPSSRIGEGEMDTLGRVSPTKSLLQKGSLHSSITQIWKHLTQFLSSFHSDLTLAWLYRHRSLKRGYSLGEHLDSPEMHGMLDMDCHLLLQLSLSPQRAASPGKIIKESQRMDLSWKGH